MTVIETIETKMECHDPTRSVTIDQSKRIKFTIRECSKCEKCMERERVVIYIE